MSLLFVSRKKQTRYLMEPDGDSGETLQQYTRNEESENDRYYEGDEYYGDEDQLYDGSDPLNVNLEQALGNIGNNYITDPRHVISRKIVDDAYDTNKTVIMCFSVLNFKFSLNNDERPVLINRFIESTINTNDVYIKAAYLKLSDRVLRKEICNRFFINRFYTVDVNLLEDNRYFSVQILNDKELCPVMYIPDNQDHNDMKEHFLNWFLLETEHAKKSELYDILLRFEIDPIVHEILERFRFEQEIIRLQQEQRAPAPHIRPRVIQNRKDNLKKTIYNNSQNVHDKKIQNSTVHKAQLLVKNTAVNISVREYLENYNLDVDNVIIIDQVIQRITIDTSYFGKNLSLLHLFNAVLHTKNLDKEKLEDCIAFIVDDYDSEKTENYEKTLIKFFGDIDIAIDDEFIMDKCYEGYCKKNAVDSIVDYITTQLCIEQKISEKFIDILRNKILFKKVSALNLLNAIVCYIHSVENEETKQDMNRRFFEEIVEMKGYCIVGHITRLMNVFRSFDEKYTIDIEFSEQLQSVISTFISKKLNETDDDNIVYGTYDDNYKEHYLTFFAECINSQLPEWCKEYGKDDVYSNIISVCEIITKSEWNIEDGKLIKV